MPPAAAATLSLDIDDEGFIEVLKSHHPKPLEARQIFLLGQGKDPNKDKIEPSEKKQANQRLTKLQKMKLVEKEGLKEWRLAQNVPESPLREREHSSADNSTTPADSEEVCMEATQQMQNMSLSAQSGGASTSSQVAELKEMMAKHTFKPYSLSELEVVVDLVKSYVEQEDRYPRFPGCCLVFLRCSVPQNIDLINWTETMPHVLLSSSTKKALKALWCSTDVPGHDSAGIFACHGNENKLIGYGVTLKPDLQTLFLNVPVEEDDRNRTGFTASLWAAWKANAVVLKVSEQRTVTVFAKQDGSKEPQVLQLKKNTAELQLVLTRLLGEAQP